MIDPRGEDYNVLVTCAVRYAIGRRSYMPHLVVAAILPHLHELEDRTLLVMENDIVGAPNLGDEDIDEPLWRNLLEKVRRERSARANRFTMLPGKADEVKTESCGGAE